MEELRELLELIGAEKACGAGLIWGLGSTEDGSNIDEAPVCSSADRALFNCVCVCQLKNHRGLAFGSRDSYMR